MARFDVFANHGKRKAVAPNWVDVQNDFLEGLTLRVVVPLLRLEYFPTGRLPGDFAPLFEIGGTKLLMHPPFIASVPFIEPGPAARSLRDHRARLPRHSIGCSAITDRQRFTEAKTAPVGSVLGICGDLSVVSVCPMPL